MLRPIAAHPFLRSPLFRTIGVTLVVLQLLAFWMVCSQQVERAQARRMAVQVQQAAFSDCLQYVVDSTIGSCTTRLGRSDAAGVPENTAAPATAVSSNGGTPAMRVAAR